MAWSFKPGMRVVCISEANALAKLKYPDVIWPQKGTVYTIRTINSWPLFTLVTLREISNDHVRVKLGHKYEPGFETRHFRPLDESRIDSLRAILNEQPASAPRIREEA